MGRKYQVISGDGHVETPPESWLKYLPEEHHERAPRLIRLPQGAWKTRSSGRPPKRRRRSATGRSTSSA